nr:AAA family ATPase [Lachnospiraceae bacterium]
MAIRDNAVFSTSLLFCSQFSQIFPEAVLYGYSNVVLMEENQIKHLLPDTNENMDDLESVYGWFQEQGLNPNLIKSGMPYLMEVLSLEEDVTEQFHAFTEYLANAPKYVPSVDILNMALKLAVLPMMEIFGKDCTMQNVFEYHSFALESVLGELDQEDGETEEFPMDYEGDYGEESMMIPQSHDILDTALIPPKRNERVKEKRTLAQLSKMYRTVGSALFETVKGQDKVILKFLEYLNRCELYKSIDDRKSVAGSFFFSGPHGSGKSLVARTIAEVLEEKYNIPYQYYNCKQYATSESVKNLLSEPSGNTTETQDSLLEFVRKNPKCTLIFENVERGDMTVIALLGAIINTGVIYDENTNSVISFEDATILFTSDFGEEFFEDRRADYSEVPKETFVQKVIYEQVDDPEMPDEIKMYYSLMLRLMDRSYVLLLNYLSIRLMLEMITSYIDYFVLQMKTEFNINIAYSPYLPQILLYRFGGSLDASNALTKTSDFLMDEIYGFLKQSSASVKKISHMNIDVEYDPKNYEIARMFEYSDHYEILFFTSKEEALTDKFKKNDHYRITRVSDYASATAMLRNGVDV